MRLRGLKACVRCHAEKKNRYYQLHSCATLTEMDVSVHIIVPLYGVNKGTQHAPTTVMQSDNRTEKFVPAQILKCWMTRESFTFHLNSRDSSTVHVKRFGTFTLTDASHLVRMSLSSLAVMRLFSLLLWRPVAFLEVTLISLFRLSLHFLFSARSDCLAWLVCTVPAVSKHSRLVNIILVDCCLNSRRIHRRALQGLAFSELFHIKLMRKFPSVPWQVFRADVCQVRLCR